MEKYYKEQECPTLLQEQWVKHVDKIASICDNACSESRDLRLKAMELRSEAESNIIWGHHRTNASIAARIEEIQRWQSTLEKCNSELKLEMDALQETLNAIEQCEDDKIPILTVTRECILLREQRQHPDNVRDNVFKQLTAELGLLATVTNQLHQCFNDGTNTLAKLRSLKCEVEEVLKAKSTAKHIEATQLNLTTTSSGVNLKPSVATLPRHIPVQSWEKSAYQLDMSVCHLINQSWNVRKSTQMLCKETTAQIKTQHEIVNYELRKRVHDLEQAIWDLEWRENKLITELNAADRVYQELDKSFQRKIEPLKLAQSRLWNRTFRPANELCNDEAHVTLAAEVDAIHQTRSHLRERTHQLACEMNTLENHLQSVKANLACKRNSLSIDQKCIQLRKKQLIPSYVIPSDVSVVPSPLDK